MARLENVSYEEIVTHLERELELNGIEEGDDIPVPTVTTAPAATLPGQGLFFISICYHRLVKQTTSFTCFISR